MIWIIVSIIISMMYWLICRCFIYYDEGWNSFKMYHFILGVLSSTIPILNVAVFIFISLTLLFYISCDEIKLKKEDNSLIRFLNFLIRFLNKKL